MPSSRKSASRRRAIPSARESRSPVSTFWRTLFTAAPGRSFIDPPTHPSPRRGEGTAAARPAPRRSLGMEPQLRDPRDEPAGVGPAVELPQARRLGLPEVVDDVLPKIRRVLRLMAGAPAIVAPGDSLDRGQAQKAYTKGRPVTRAHSSPRSSRGISPSK